MGTATGIISKANRAVTAATTISGNETVLVDATAAAVTITGPAAATARRWGVKKTDSSTNPVTVSYVNAAGSTTTLSLAYQDDGKTFEPLNSGYAIVATDRSRVQDALLYAAAQTPPTTAATAGQYDRRANVYNLKPGHLRRTRAALAKARAGAGFATIACLGDSTTAGTGAVSGSTDWPTQLSNLLATQGLGSSGSGFVAAGKGATADTRWTVGSGWAALSGYSSLLVNSTTTNALVFTSTNTGTTAIVHFSRGSGPFSVTLDGSTPAAVTITGGTYSGGVVSPANTSGYGVLTVTGLANTTHVWSITRSSGNAQIFGAEVQSAAFGLRFLNAGIGGGVVPPAGSNAWFTTETIASASGSNGFNADLVLVMLETNDAGTTAVATYKSAMQTFLTTIKTNGSDLVLVTAVPSGGKTFGLYTQALYELADSLDVPLVDLQDRWGSYATMNGYGLMNDGLHPNPSGYAEIARSVQTALAL